MNLYNYKIPSFIKLDLKKNHLNSFKNAKKERKWANQHENPLGKSQSKTLFPSFFIFDHYKLIFRFWSKQKQ